MWSMGRNVPGRLNSSGAPNASPVANPRRHPRKRSVLMLRFVSGIRCSGPAPCPFDEDSERFALLAERFHRFPVPGVFALLALVSGPPHLPDAEPYGAYADGSDCKLAEGYPFRCCHCVSLFLSPRDEIPLGQRSRLPK